MVLSGALGTRMVRNMTRPISLLAIVQNGRLAYEALVFMASLAKQGFPENFRPILAEPCPGDLWEEDPGLYDPEIRSLLGELGAKIVPFQNSIWGSRYPQGNKIEALTVLDPDAPFVFFDTDTLFVGDPGRVPFDFSRPSASLRVEPTWPSPWEGGPGRDAIWASLYRLTGIRDPKDAGRPYPYYNAGFFCHASPAEFHRRFVQIATKIENEPPPELDGQRLYPWLDQIALPLVLESFGGVPEDLPQGLIDGRITCHWRTLPLLYARESDAVIETLEKIAGEQHIKRILRRWEPARRMIYQGEGRKARALFTDDVPDTEEPIRKRLRAAGLWIR